jgi:hypothetical protein
LGCGNLGSECFWKEKGLNKRDNLLLLVGLLLLLGLATGLTDAVKTGNGAGLAVLLVGRVVLLSLGDLASLLLGPNLGDGEDSASQLGSSRELGGSRVTSLGLASLAGEDNQLGLVSLEALNVELERLLGLVAATVVDRNTDGKSLLAADTGSLFRTMNDELVSCFGFGFGFSFVV